MVELGQLKVTPFVSSRFRLDGGSMFGVVPWVLWERKAPPDALNRILLNSNSLLVETDGLKVLVEPGMGSKYDKKQRELYDLADTDVISALAGLGVEPGQIDLVVATHLHLDHVGGATGFSGAGLAEPAFANARVVVQRDELEAALDPHPLSKGSYRRDDIAPLIESGRMMVVEGEAEVAPGVRVELTGGHTPGHQLVWLGQEGRQALYVGDLVPTCAHLRLNWLMAWDLDPRTVYEQKARLLADCAARAVWVCWSHDPAVAACHLLAPRPGSYEIDEGSIIEAGA